MSFNRQNLPFNDPTQYPTSFAYSATPSLDVSANNEFKMSGAMTANMALTLVRGEDGDSGVILVAQDGTGGWKITGVTALGRTVQMRDDLTTINTAAMLVASAITLIAYQYVTVAGVAIVLLSVTTGIAAAYT